MKVEDYFEKKKSETDKSFAFLVERCSHSEESPYGIKLCEKIDMDKPLVVVLPGTANDADMLHATNGLLKKVDEFVFNNLAFDRKDVQLCAAVCYYGKYFKPDTARRLLYLFYKDYQIYSAQMRNFDQPEIVEYAVPNYAVDLYDLLIWPRICDSCNRLLPFKEALRRMQKLIVVSYCHGAYSWMKIEEQLSLQWSGNEYSASQKRRLLKSITILAYSPDCPLGVSDAQFISLASASDLSIQHGNNFIRYVHRGLFVEDFGLSYWPRLSGSAFYCAQFSNNGIEGNARVLTAIDPTEWYENLYQGKKEEKNLCLSEHDFLGFIPYPNMSRAALKLQQIGKQILETSLKNALSAKPKKLSVFALVGGFHKHFWTFQKARLQGMIILFKTAFWLRKKHQASFADTVRFVNID